MKTEITNELTSELVNTLFAISKVTSKLAAKITALEEMGKERKEAFTSTEISNLAKGLNNYGNILIAVSEDVAKLQSLRNPKKNS